MPARLSRAARVLTGGALAAAALATTAAMPVTAAHPAGHGHRASASAPGRPAGRGLRPSPRASSAALWIHIAAGGGHTCGIRMGNTLWCWGANANGQLGIGPTGDQDLPRQITYPTTRWASVTAGDADTCATRTDGTLWCWGWNDFGQLGIGPTGEQDSPQQVTSPASTGWTSTAAGDVHTCATRARTLWCWGDGTAGQLGSGITRSVSTPRQVQQPARAGWILITGGSQHSCATRTDGTLWCWGYNGDGELGTGTTTSHDTPQQVTS